MADKRKMWYAWGPMKVVPKYANNDPALVFDAEPVSGRGADVTVEVRGRDTLKKLRDAIDAFLQEGQPLDMAQQKMQAYEQQLEKEMKEMIAVKRKELAKEHGVDEDELES